MKARVHAQTPSPTRRPSRRHTRSWNTWIALATVLIAGVALYGVLTSVTPPKSSTRITTLTSPPPGSAPPTYPVGVVDHAEPSGMAPPAANALPHYTLTYASDFSGSTLPSTWQKFTGKPGGDPGAQWAANHVEVAGGMLRLNTFRDVAYANNWVSGGVCQCDFAQTYGAYFVRSRMTAEGPNDVELLWPLAKVWPPEIDFNETDKPTYTTGTVHFGANNQIDQVQLMANTLQWHTWGVIWTPKSITYTVDGQVWGTVKIAAEIPNQPMTLDIDQQTWCGRGWGCPTGPDSMLIDWIAEYAPAR